MSPVVDVVQRLQLAIEASRTTMGQTSVSSRRLIEILLDESRKRESFYEEPPYLSYQNNNNNNNLID